MKDYASSDLRNFAVLGHASAGKTLLTEAMLLCSGRIGRMGTIAAVEHLVLRGEGVAVLPKYLVQKRLEAGTLRVVFPKVKPGCDHLRLVFRAADERRADYEALSKLLLEAPLR